MRVQLLEIGLEFGFGFLCFLGQICNFRLYCKLIPVLIVLIWKKNIYDLLFPSGVVVWPWGKRRNFVSLYTRCRLLPPLACELLIVFVRSVPNQRYQTRRVYSSPHYAFGVNRCKAAIFFPRSRVVGRFLRPQYFQCLTQHKLLSC